jgi:hypothetical protein
MARPLSQLRERKDPTSERAHENWLTRTMARTFAAAVTSLLIATLVVNRSNEALSTEGTAAGSALSTGSISLSDDDSGRALFDFSNMAPGRPIIRCIEIAYDGTITPVDLTLASESTGDLGAFMDVKVETGTGAGFDSCDGFTSEDTVFTGTLATFTDSEALDLGRFVNTGQTRSFRITTDIQDVQEALGRAASADFIWEVTPS